MLWQFYTSDCFHTCYLGLLYCFTSYCYCISFYTSSVVFWHEVYVHFLFKKTFCSSVRIKKSYQHFKFKIWFLTATNYSLLKSYTEQYLDKKTHLGHPVQQCQILLSVIMSSPHITLLTYLSIDIRVPYDSISDTYLKATHTHTICKGNETRCFKGKPHALLQQSIPWFGMLLKDMRVVCMRCLW